MGRMISLYFNLHIYKRSQSSETRETKRENPNSDFWNGIDSIPLLLHCHTHSHTPVHRFSPLIHETLIFRGSSSGERRFRVRLSWGGRCSSISSEKNGRWQENHGESSTLLRPQNRCREEETACERWLRQQRQETTETRNQLQAWSRFHHERRSREIPEYSLAGPILLTLFFNSLLKKFVFESSDCEWNIWLGL